MIQFNIHRFGKLTKWTLSFDRAYYIKSFLQIFVMGFLMFVAFSTRFFTFIDTTISARYAPCAAVYVGVLVVHLMLGPSLVFYSFKNRRDDQNYMMLPASNLEKYLVRYVGLILLLFILAAALMASDLFQYLLNKLIGKQDSVFVLGYLIDRLSQASKPELFSMKEVVNMTVSLLWLNSLYVLGGTFFRSHRYAWVLVTLIIISLSMLLAWILPNDNVLSLGSESPLHTVILVNAFYVAWILLNYWLAYRCFCRSQVIGKYINM